MTATIVTNVIACGLMVAGISVLLFLLLPNWFVVRRRERKRHRELVRRQNRETRDDWRAAMVPIDRMPITIPIEFAMPPTWHRLGFARTEIGDIHFVTKAGEAPVSELYVVMPGPCGPAWFADADRMIKVAQVVAHILADAADVRVELSFADVAWGKTWSQSIARVPGDRSYIAFARKLRGGLPMIAVADCRSAWEPWEVEDLVRSVERA